MKETQSDRPNASEGAAVEELVEENRSPPCFPKLNALPPELRHMIWTLALPSDTSEILVLQVHKHRRTTSETSGSSGDDILAEPPEPSHPLAHTGYPVHMHVCRESRLLAQSQTQLEYSPVARCKVPVRRFRPELDVLYIGWFLFLSFFRRPEYFYGMHFIKTLRHIAIDVVLTTNPGGLVEALRHLKALETLHIVFGTSNGPLWAGSALRCKAPVRRCALRAFNKDDMNGMVTGGRMTRPRTLECYLEYIHDELFEQDRMLSILQHGSDDEDDEEGDAETSSGFLRGEWDLELVADVFVEFRRSADDGAQWVEKGKSDMAELVSNIAWDIGMGIPIGDQSPSRTGYRLTPAPFYRIQPDPLNQPKPRH
ncbi:hypothetical protein F5Y15DRAFT_413782 [Xylariaceae sp. FL0016]|nr:hypothetical protein F5Y15DRAFT_413782 [Xylariaceae sp. FL0016]